MFRALPAKLYSLNKLSSDTDFKRIAEPLSKFGARFKLQKNKNLTLKSMVARI